MLFEIEVQGACERAFSILKQTQLRFRPMKRQSRVNPKRGYVIGRTNLKTGLITIDILTPVERNPKKISSILRTLCHEIAHHQKKPYRQLFRGHFINRQHYPAYYRQVSRNINALKKDNILKEFFK